MWELDYKESWAPKNWCFWTVMLEKTWESLGLQGDPTSPSWRRSVLGVHWKDWCWSWNSNTLAIRCEELTHRKRPWCWERLKAGGEGTTEDEMVGWHHRLNGHEFEQALGVGDGQGNLACCSPWGCKELDTTYQLNWRISPQEGLNNFGSFFSEAFFPPEISGLLRFAEMVWLHLQLGDGWGLIESVSYGRDLSVLFKTC